MPIKGQKREPSHQELLEAALSFQVQILDALLSSRAWTMDEIAFQGGTSLKLAHGSARFSEDLDFLLAQELADKALDFAQVTLARVRESMALEAPEDEITLKTGRRSGNTLPFTFVRTSRRFRNSIRVKTEFQAVPRALLKSYRKELVAFALPPQMRAGVRAMLPAATLDSIYADKILAIVNRPYLKPRDFFDLWWLRTQRGIKEPTEQENLAERITTAAAMYGKTRTDTIEALDKFLHGRRVDEIGEMLASDLPRWLPEAMVRQFDQQKTWRAMSEIARADLEATVQLLKARPAAQESEAARASAKRITGRSR